MSLVAMVYYVLLAQCVVLTMLCLPYVRNVITWFGKFIPVNTVKWYILLAIGIVAFMSEGVLENSSYDIFSLRCSLPCFGLLEQDYNKQWFYRGSAQDVQAREPEARARPC